MKCPECGKEPSSVESLVRGYCEECNQRKLTCEVCNEPVEFLAVNARTGKRGHYICVIDESAVYGNDCPSGACDV